MVSLIDKEIGNKKAEFLDYYRNRSKELISEVNKEYSKSKPKQMESKIKNGLDKTKDTLIETLKQNAENGNWNSQDILEGILMITYTNGIAMLESRNDI